MSDPTTGVPVPDPLAGAPMDPSTSPGGLPDFSIAKSVGPFQYGLLMAWALLGLLIHQVYIYNTRFAHKDAPLFRIVVHLVLVIEIVMVGILTHLVHYTLVEGWGNPLALIQQPWSAHMIGLSTSMTALVVQLFFLWRIWKINQDSVLIRVSACFVSLLVLLHFGCGIGLANPIYYGNTGVEPGHNTNELEIVSVLIEMGLSVAFSVDVLITILMVISLLRLRKQSKAIRSTAAKLNTLIIRAIETGAVTSVVALIALVLYEHPDFSSTAYYLACNFALGRLYSTMLLTNLNGRGHFSGAADAGTMRSINVGYDVELDTRFTGSVRRPGTDVMVTTQVNSSLDSKTKKESFSG